MSKKPGFILLTPGRCWFRERGRHGFVVIRCFVCNRDGDAVGLREFFELKKMVSCHLSTRPLNPRLRCCLQRKCHWKRLHRLLGLYDNKYKLSRCLGQQGRHSLSDSGLFRPFISYKEKNYVNKTPVQHRLTQVRAQHNRTVLTVYLFQIFVKLN